MCYLEGNTAYVANVGDSRAVGAHLLGDRLEVPEEMRLKKGEGDEDGAKDGEGAEDGDEKPEPKKKTSSSSKKKKRKKK